MPYREIEIIDSTVNLLEVLCEKCGRELNDGGGTKLLLLNHHGYPYNPDVICATNPLFWAVKPEGFYNLHSKQKKATIIKDYLKELDITSKRRLEEFEHHRKANVWMGDILISKTELREAELHVLLHNIFLPDHITRRCLFICNI